MTHVFHRDPRVTLPVAVRGEGVYIVDEAGRRYLDASGGAAVSCLGHSHGKVVEAIQRQAAALPFAHTGFFTNQPMEELADALIADAPAGLDKVYFVSGGSEATEAALKLARQYFLELGQPARRHFIARRQSYHGNTLGALAVGGNANRRRPYEPLLMAVSHISPCYAYRDQQPGETEEAYGHRAADALEAAIMELGAESVAGFIAEPVVGATLGAVPAVPGYFKRIREICDRHGLLLILDEVMCGMGRTGTLYACTQDGVAPDLLTVAKGLGAGYQPIGALLASYRIFDTVTTGSGQFRHGHTYMGHATACAAALAVQKAIREEDLLEAVNRQGHLLRTLLDERFADHPHIGDIRGRGLFLGLELVADRATKAPFDPVLQLHARIKGEAMRQGLMCYPMGGTADGTAGDHVLLAPPFIVTADQVHEIVDRLAKAIDLALDAAQASKPR